MCWPGKVSFVWHVMSLQTLTTSRKAVVHTTALTDGRNATSIDNSCDNLWMRLIGSFELVRSLNEPIWTGRLDCGSPESQFPASEHCLCWNDMDIVAMTPCFLCRKQIWFPMFSSNGLLGPCRPVLASGALWHLCNVS